MCSFFSYRICNIQGLDQDSDAAMSFISNTTAKLTSAVSSLPQLLEKKRLLDMHTTIATGLLSGTKPIVIYFDFFFFFFLSTIPHSLAGKYQASQVGRFLRSRRKGDEQKCP